MLQIKATVRARARDSLVSRLSLLSSVSRWLCVANIFRNIRRASSASLAYARELWISVIRARRFRRDCCTRDSLDYILIFSRSSSFLQFREKKRRKFIQGLGGKSARLVLSRRRRPARTLMMIEIGREMRRSWIIAILIARCIVIYFER